MSGMFETWLDSLVSALQEREKDANVVVVDWLPLAHQLYTDAVNNTQIVGKTIARLLDWLQVVQARSSLCCNVGEGLLHKAAEPSPAPRLTSGAGCAVTPSPGLGWVMAHSCTAAALPPWRCCLAACSGQWCCSAAVQFRFGRAA